LGGVLRLVVSLALDRLGILAAVFRIRTTGPPRSLRRAQRPPARARCVSLDGPLRSEAGAAAVGVVPAGGRRGGAVRDGGDMRAGAGVASARSRGRRARRAARRRLLPAEATDGAR